MIQTCLFFYILALELSGKGKQTGSEDQGNKNIVSLLNELEGQTGEYLAPGHSVHTKRNEDRAP